MRAKSTQRTSFQEEARSYVRACYAGDRGFLCPSGKERPIGRSKDGSLHLPPEHGELVAQNYDLDVLLSLAPSAKSQELEESPEHYIEEGEDHEPRIVPSRRLIDHLACSVLRIGFLYPTGIWASVA